MGVTEKDKCHLAVAQSWPGVSFNAQECEKSCGGVVCVQVGVPPVWWCGMYGVRGSPVWWCGMYGVTGSPVWWWCGMYGVKGSPVCGVTCMGVRGSTCVMVCHVWD